MRRCFVFTFVLCLLAGCGRGIEFAPTPSAVATTSALATKLPTVTSAPTATSIPTSTPVPPPVTFTPTLEPTPRARYNAPGDHFVQVVSGNQDRSFNLHVPPDYQPGVPMPLVLDLHGLGSNASEQARLDQMSAKADREGFIVVYPQAFGAPPAWFAGVGPEAIADTIFLRDLIDFLQARMSIDPTRVYATGFSNGGGMANRLGCSVASKLAAIASVSGAYLFGASCRPARPLPVLAFHGTDDQIVPYDGGDVLPSVPDWAAAWAERNGCDPTPTIIYQQGDVTGETWENCEANATVTLYTIDGGGHGWPGSGLAQVLNPESRDINATDLIWEFFESHSRP